MEKDLEIEVPERTRDAPINASGHRQELDRNFRLIEICGLGITSGNTWIAIGGSIVRFLYSGE
jgi:choline transport protein